MHLLHPRNKQADYGEADGCQSGKYHAQEDVARVVLVTTGSVRGTFAFGDEDDRDEAGTHGE